MSAGDLNQTASTVISGVKGPNWFRTSFRRLLVLAGVPWLIALLMLVIFERSMLYPAPSQKTAELPPGVEEVRFRSADGFEAIGWFLPREGSERTLIYFHGNGEDVPRCWADATHLARSINANLLLPEYRGYGNSAGKPSEDALVKDGVAAFDWVKNQQEIKHLPLVLSGRSIGSGVASCVAGQRPPDILILVSGFSSIVDVAASKFPIFPIRLLMKNRYECQASLTNARYPVLMIHGSVDSIIPMRFGRTLFDSLPEGKREFVVLDGMDHNDFGSPDFVDHVLNFLAD